MFNEKVVVIQSQDATDYRYDYVGFRRQNGSSKQEDGEHLEMVWQGFQIDQNKVVLDPIQLLSVQPHYDSSEKMPIY